MRTKSLVITTTTAIDSRVLGKPDDYRLRLDPLWQGARPAVSYRSSTRVSFKRDRPIHHGIMKNDVPPPTHLRRTKSLPAHLQGNDEYTGKPLFWFCRRRRGGRGGHEKIHTATSQRRPLMRLLRLSTNDRIPTPSEGPVLTPDMPVVNTYHLKPEDRNDTFESEATNESLTLIDYSDDEEDDIPFAYDDACEESVCLQVCNDEEDEEDGYLLRGLSFLDDAERE